MIETIELKDLKEPKNSSVNRTTLYFERIFEGSLDDCDVFIAGGCFRSYFSNDEEINDIDVFSNNRGELARVLINLRNKFNFKPFFINNNAIKGFIMKRGKKINIDIVKRTFGNEIETLECFDFSIAMMAYNLKTKNFYYHPSCFIDILQKRLVIPKTPLNNPLGVLKRLHKYTKYGYSACNGTLITIAKELQELDLNNPDNNDIEFYPDGRERIPLFD